MSSYLKSLPFFVPERARQKRRYIVDSVLVLGSIAILTSIVAFVHLSVNIPDSLLIYLLLILAFACIRGLYAALLASFLAFFVFDFFFVSPFYSFAASKFEDVLGLIVFLVAALITGQLTSALRLHAIQSDQREHETYILYDLMRATNRENDLESQLYIFTNAVVKVFSSWGIRDCMLLLPDAQGTLKAQPGATQKLDHLKLLPDEEILAAWVMEHARTVDLYNRITPLSSDLLIWQEPHTEQHGSVSHFIRLVPLKAEKEVVGVLRLLIEEDSSQFTLENHLEMDHVPPASQAVFFSTFLEQAVTVIEQGRLRRESLSLKVFQQTEALRTALLSSVSHDLRSPLSTIKTATTSLLQEEIQRDKEVLSNLASAIEREVDRLDFLVENILDMSRIEAGILHPEKIWYPLGDVVLDVIGRMQPLLQNRTVQTCIPDTLPPVEIDYVQIDQVVSNLIENAIDHTPDASPIDVSIEAQKGHLLVSVADRGPGIPQDEREHIFEKFYRLSRKANAPGRPRGLGLGLAICRGIIEAHRGQIWVQPRDGGGSVFCFTLPLNDNE